MSRQALASRWAGRARNWRLAFTHPVPSDAWDPATRFVRGVLGWDWPQLLIIAFLIYGPFEKLLVPRIGGYLHLTGSIRTWVPDVEALLTGFVEFPFFMAYYLWTDRGIGQIFLGLERNKSFSDEKGYQAFLERVRASFSRQRWSALSLGFAAVAIVYAHFVLWGPGTAAPPWFGQERVFSRILALLLIAVVAYAAAQVVIREVLAVHWLGRLWIEQGDHLVVHPYHPDEAGGLGAIGHHAVNLSSFALMVMLFIAVGSLLPSLRGTGGVSVELWNPATALLIVLFLTIVPLLFILLMLPAHQAMQKARDAQLEQVSAQLDRQLWVVHQTAAQDPGKISAVLDQIAHLKATWTLLMEDYPIWPTNTAIRRQFSISYILSLATSIVALIGPVRALLSKP